MSGFWTYHSLKCVRVTQGSKYAWIYLNNFSICLVKPECAYICLNGFCFTLTHCNPLSKGTIDCFLGKKKFNFFYSNGKYLILFFVFRLNICTTKVLNFLLPLWAKGTRGFESYASEIPNKYIYNAFLMIYLSILLLLFYSLFGTPKELIGYSQTL